jgi:hypothetical protein
MLGAKNSTPKCKYPKHGISDQMHRHITELSDRLFLLSNGKTYEIKERERLFELGYLHSL